MPGLDGATIRRRLADARLYLCMDARRGNDSDGTPDLRAMAELADAALSGGVDLVQLRDKGHPAGPLEAKPELAALEVIAEACARHGALLSVNDRADVALAAGADVLHLGQDDLPLPVARRILGDEVVIGRSTHDVGQVDAATTESGLDYFCVGPCWPTPTKPGRPAPGLDLVRHAAAVCPPDEGRPWFAIGGIDHERLPDVLDAGATRIVVVRVITGADDPADAAGRLRSRLDPA